MVVSRRVNFSTVRCVSILEVWKMADVATQENRIRSGPLMATVRLVTWAAPIALWLIHIFVIVPILNSLSGEAQFITAMDFFMVSALIMIGCLLLSTFVFFKKHSPADHSIATQSIVAILREGVILWANRRQSLKPRLSCSGI